MPIRHGREVSTLLGTRIDEDLGGNVSVNNVSEILDDETG
jgi:hypothetical protein